MTEIGDNINAVTAGQLKSFVERIENLEADIKALNADKSEVYAEAKANGFDVPVIKKIIAIRRQDPQKRAEQDAVLELYLAALGS